MLLLTQFILRLSFGLSLAMACTSPRWVSSGYYRNNLYVLLGLIGLACLGAWMGLQQTTPLPVWPPLLAAVLSYAGAVFWQYERARPGLIALGSLARVALIGAWLADARPEMESFGALALHWLDPIGGGLVLGVTMAAMLLGHWYLNAPGI